ncbi:hypothetical protein L3Q67_26465 [Saccharothrix sp. AJ9571]|nr:hypothetical protein L3Q67_26465 [Saccharothrix sp. AJ9571]
MIAESVYGKPYNSLRGCQQGQTDSPLPNDSVKVYELESDPDDHQALHDIDAAEFYLGYDRDRQVACSRPARPSSTTG